MEITEVGNGLTAFILAECGSRARLRNLAESDGHAGLTFLFEIDDGSAASLPYVIKLPPKGVKLRGNTDVYRQAPLLRALKADGAPVPDVPWAYEANPWFDVPFIIMERLPGKTFFVWDPVPDLPVSATDCARMWDQATTCLARLHAFDWNTRLPQWEAPASLEREVSRWARIYAQAPEQDWITAAALTQQALLDTLPSDFAVGLFHGDFQPGNCLYDGAQLTGIIDWELSGIGAQLLDVGWLSMVSDEQVWTPQWHPMRPPTLAHICELYASESGRSTDLVPWFEALAAYRLAAISCLNVKLHRSGKRHDPIWEMNALSVLPMFHRARELVQQYR